MRAESCRGKQPKKRRPKLVSGSGMFSSSSSCWEIQVRKQKKTKKKEDGESERKRMVCVYTTTEFGMAGEWGGII